ncbi:MAG: PLP-dependent aminotransferase family protein [Pseudomonadota bacterium]
MGWNPKLGQSGKPHYIGIAEAIEADIEASILKPGDRLPPQRQLAERLGVDFTTVSRGYAEAQSRGLVDAHVGRGTFVRHTNALADLEPDESRTLAKDLSMNMPPEPTDPALLARMQDALSYVGTNLVALLRYQNAAGSEKDITAASTWISQRGLIPKLERICVVPGAHAAMTGIVSLICRPGDTILCERVTYPGLRTIAAHAGVRLVGVEIDDDGITPEALTEAITDASPAALYLNPTLHNPTTLTIPNKRRLQIAEIITQSNIPLIEDDAYGFIPADSPAPLAASAPDLTWHIAGLAKCIGAGLRLAYVTAPSARRALEFAQIMRAQSVMPSPVSMALATHWIEDGTADQIRRFLRTETAARQAIAARILAGSTFKSHPHAFNIYLDLPDGITRADLMARMTGHEIGIVPSDPFTIDEQPGEHVRVCLGGPIDREQLTAALERMSHALTPTAWLG